MELWRVGEFMKPQRGFNDRARESGINMKNKIANLFYELSLICSLFKPPLTVALLQLLAK